MTPEQCRAGRGWLDWSQAELASEAHVSLSTVRDFEKGRRVPIANNREAIRAALEKAGVGFSFVMDGDEKKACGITFTITNEKSAAPSAKPVDETSAFP
jgi:transcriptional regulator with XRE-family HTH domain